MDENDWLAERFEEQRTHLRAVAYRMLGSLTEADDAVQDTWVRASRAGDERGRESRRVVDDDRRPGLSQHAPVAQCPARGVLGGASPRSGHQPPRGSSRPEEEALLADSVGLALQVVLDALAPAERLAFVLHDMFELPFEEIAPMVGRSPAAARQLASRARRRVKGRRAPCPDPDLARQRAVVDAFFLAARGGDFDALVALLHPDVVLRADFGPGRPAASRSSAGRPLSPGRRAWVPIRRPSSTLRWSTGRPASSSRWRGRAARRDGLHRRRRPGRRDRRDRRPRTCPPSGIGCPFRRVRLSRC